MRSGGSTWLWAAINPQHSQWLDMVFHSKKSKTVVSSSFSRKAERMSWCLGELWPILESRTQHEISETFETKTMGQYPIWKNHLSCYVFVAGPKARRASSEGGRKQQPSQPNKLETANAWARGTADKRARESGSAERHEPTQISFYSAVTGCELVKSMQTCRRWGWSSCCSEVGWLQRASFLGWGMCPELLPALC